MNRIQKTMIEMMEEVKKEYPEQEVVIATSTQGVFFRTYIGSKENIASQLCENIGDWGELPKNYTYEDLLNYKHYYFKATFDLEEMVQDLCPYCGENETNSPDKDILCNECAEMFKSLINYYIYQKKQYEKEMVQDLCPYCGGNETNSPDKDILCNECAEMFGHARYSEL